MAYKSIHTGSQIDEAVTAVINKQADWDKKEVVVTATLAASSWTNKRQEVAVSGVSADAASQVVEVAPTSDCMDASIKALIKPVSQRQGHITFECSNVPSSDIKFVVSIKSVS